MLRRDRNRKVEDEASVATPLPVSLPAEQVRTGWEAIVELALAEDIGGGDVTTLATVPSGAHASGTLLVKASGVLSGVDVVGAVFRQVNPALEYRIRIGDGTRVNPGDRIADIAGSAQGILAAERVALNLLQRLSGVATQTASYVEAVAGTKARIIDTRKTTPGLRVLEKAAVRHGGGRNHRFGLSDGILIKDNHLAAIGGPDRVTRAVRQAATFAPHTMRVEVEVTSLAEVEEAVAAGADAILLDNMDVATMHRAVELVAGRAILEASGGVTLETVRAIAETGVDLISVGALTHSAPALDISLEVAVDS